MGFLCGAVIAPVQWLLVALIPSLLQAQGVPSKSPTPALPQSAWTIVDLQSARRAERVLLGGEASATMTATLTNLNPEINASLLLTLQLPGRTAPLEYHLENPDPQRRRVVLDVANPGALTIKTGGATMQCSIWPNDLLEQARRSKLSYAPLCEGKLYLRNTVEGNRSSLEATTEFLRDHVWAGEQIIGFVRREFYVDSFIERARPASAAQVGKEQASPSGAPPAALIRAADAQQAVHVDGLGVDLGRQAGLVLGQWYPAAGLKKVFVSVVRPGSTDAAVTAGVSAQAALDPVEADALAYLVGFDLAEFELGFALGTEHPRLGWSDRVRPGERDTRLAGPDGIGNALPLERAGMVNPELQSRVIATFTGGFKREHGAFRHGALAAVNQGSHYGFVEQGVVFSRLVPGLSTVYVLADGSVGMNTWAREDDSMLGQIRHARQNGVALLERNPTGDSALFGALLDQWGPGNWSGSVDEKLRSLRAGACVIDHAGRRFLVYGYFSAATPRTMARVLRAYGCGYAMHLDMNALEHTYLAMYPRSGSNVVVEHLVRGMEVLDKTVAAKVVPRFLGFADDRDFFYLMTRKESQ